MHIGPFTDNVLPCGLFSCKLCLSVQIIWFLSCLQLNYGCRVFECLNPVGEIQPGGSALIHWVFAPLEAKTYMVCCVSWVLSLSLVIHLFCKVANFFLNREGGSEKGRKKRRREGGKEGREGREREREREKGGRERGREGRTDGRKEGSMEACAL